MNILITYRLVSFDFFYTKGDINCVRWDSNGERLASASEDKTVKMIDLASEKVIYTGATSDSSK